MRRSVNLTVAALCLPWIARDLRAGDLYVPIDPAAAGAASQSQEPNGATQDADSTKRNAQDRGQTVTPMDQGNTAADLSITRRIRRAVVGHEGFSTDAKNVKIVTRDGVVTLRGPVKSQAEKTEIESLAKNIGVKQVDNQIEVEAQR